MNDKNIIEEYFDMERNTYKHSKRSSRALSRDADRYLRFCYSCQKVWEKQSRTDSDNKNIIYYDDFPSLGKERQQCRKCI